MRQSVRGMVVLGLLFALVGLLIGLRTIAVSTLPHILAPEAGINYQEVTDRLPVPHLLDWDLSQIEMLINLRAMNGLLLFLAGLALGGALWFGAARALNPTFRLFQFVRHQAEPSGGQSEGEAGAGSASRPGSLDAHIETHGATKAALLLLLTGLPILLLWLLIHILLAKTASPAARMSAGLYLPRWNPLWALFLMALGALLWVGFHRSGLAGDFNAPPLNPTRSELPKLALRGVTWGLLTFLIGCFAVPSSLEPTLTNYQALGTFNLTYWHQIASHYLLCVGATWFAAGALLYLFARGETARQRQALLLAAPLIAAGVALWSEQIFLPGAFTARYDLTPAVLNAISAPYRPDHGGSGVPDGPEAARALARLLHLGMGAQAVQPERSVLIFREDGSIVNVRQNGYTLDGLTADPASVGKITAFLKQRRYRSALSWVAIKHLFDLCALHFDTTSGLDTLLDDLAYGPHLQQGGRTTMTLFFICAASPDNLALLDKWADSNRFGYPDRFAVRLIGDLYRRFGAVDKALAWYRKADMPHSFMARIRAEHPLFHQGHVRGVLRLNGQPLADVQVGLVPWRLNGLPRHLEPLVGGSIGEIYAFNPASDLFPPFHPVPYAFRWISASTVTDSQGAFTLDYLTEGQYRFICTLPPQYRLNPPMDRSLRVTNPPTPFAVHYGNPGVNLGIIDLKIENR